MSTEQNPNQPEAAPSLSAAGSEGFKKPPFTEFLYRAFYIGAILCCGIMRLTSRSHKSDFEFWANSVLGGILITLGILNILVSAVRLAVATVEMNKGNNPPNDKGEP